MIDIEDLRAHPDTMISSIDTFPSTISIGGDGANQTWDFTNVTEDIRDTTMRVDPTTLTFFADFPNTNLGIVELDGGAPQEVYLDSSVTGLRMLGFAGDFMGPGTYLPFTVVPHAQTVDFPLTHLDNSVYDFVQGFTVPVSFFGPTVDSFQIKSMVHTEDTVDGWGTLITPSGTYAAHREVEWIYRVDSNFTHDTLIGWQFLNETFDTTRYYRWYSDNLFYTAETLMDSTFTGIEEFHWTLSPPAVGIEDPIGVPASMTVFPNPFDEEAAVAYELEKQSEVSITLENYLGQTLAELLPPQKQPPGAYKILVEASHFGTTSGIYFIRMKVGEHVMVRKLIVE